MATPPRLLVQGISSWKELPPVGESISTPSIHMTLLIIQHKTLKTQQENRSTSGKLHGEVSKHQFRIQALRVTT